MCPFCWPVVLAYQKSVAASIVIQEWWAKDIKPKFPNLQLMETEPVYLLPYARAKKTKKEAATMLTVLDFRVSDISKKPATPLFHIEQKAGPGSIEEISNFQLDVNDFNDIVGATNNTKLPSYVVHVQLHQQYSFPTRATVIGGLWWTDVFNLQDHQIRIIKRRGEEKKAICYNPAAFQPITTFNKELEEERYLELGRKLATNTISPVD